MHADYRLLKKQIIEERDTITDQELFTSSAYEDYQSSLAESATKRYYSGVHIVLGWDTAENADYAYTDSNRIFINAANPITINLPTRYLKSLSMTGFNAHECGHLLFTDFTALQIYGNSLLNGNFYPKSPKAEHYENNLTEIQAAIATQDKAVCKTLCKMAHHLTNIMEDVYIEARMCQKFPGTFAAGIYLNNERFEEQTPSIQSQIDKGYRPYAIMMNLILSYCRNGDVNNITDYKGEYLDALEECIPYIEDAIYEPDPKERFSAANEILVILWDYIKQVVDEIENRPEQDSALEELEQELEQQVNSGAQLPQKRGRAKIKDSGNISPQAIRQGQLEAQKVLKEETERLEMEKTNQLSKGHNPGVTYNRNYAGAGYQDAAKDMLEVLTTLATEKANLTYEKELSAELQKQAAEIRYGDIHKGCHVNINRITYVSPDLKRAYDQVKAPLLAISKRLQKQIMEILEKKRNSEKLSRLPYGRRLEARYLYQDDGAYFSRTRLPGDGEELAVALLVDESGSMSGSSRITMARQAAIILYEFCHSLNIPISIYGHCESFDVELYSYAEFDSLDMNDCYRLMDMSARGCNRDGAALRFVAERLVIRNEETKILILISDGQPNGDGYHGTAAAADLRAIKQEYRKKGVILFAAAIGDDKEKIKEIYQDGFLDITDLNKLPKLLPTLISRYIKE